MVREIIREENLPLEEDFRSAKRWVAGLFLTLITAAVGVGMWVGTIQEQVSHIEDDQRRFEDRIEDKLIRIESLLLELSREISGKN